MPARFRRRRGAAFDLAAEPPLRAQLYALGETASGEPEHVLLLLLHHIAGDGWSLVAAVAGRCASFTRRGGRAVRRRCRRCRCNTPTTRCGSRTVLGDESDAASALSRQLSYWSDRLAGLPEQLELPTDRPRPAVASYRGDAIAVCAACGAAWRAAQACAGERGEPVHGAAGGSCGAVEPAGRRAPTLRSARRSRGAPTLRWTIWWGSSSTRWCCAPTPRATRASGS